MWWLTGKDGVALCLKMWWLIGEIVVGYWWRCGGSLVMMWWLNVWRCGGSMFEDVVAHWGRCDGSLVDGVVPHWWRWGGSLIWRCGGSLLKMWCFIGEDVALHWWRCGASLVKMWWLIGLKIRWLTCVNMSWLIDNAPDCWGSGDQFESGIFIRWFWRAAGSLCKTLNLRV